MALVVGDTFSVSSVGYIQLFPLPPSKEKRKQKINTQIHNAATTSPFFTKKKSGFSTKPYFILLPSKSRYRAYLSRVDCQEVITSPACIKVHVKRHD